MWRVCYQQGYPVQFPSYHNAGRAGWEIRSVDLDALPAQAGGHHDHVCRPCHRGCLRRVGKPALGTQVREAIQQTHLLMFGHCPKAGGEGGGVGGQTLIVGGLTLIDFFDNYLKYSLHPKTIL